MLRSCWARAEAKARQVSARQAAARRGRAARVSRTAARRPAELRVTRQAQSAGPAAGDRPRLQLPVTARAARAARAARKGQAAQAAQATTRWEAPGRIPAEAAAEARALKAMAPSPPRSRAYFRNRGLLASVSTHR